MGNQQKDLPAPDGAVVLKKYPATPIVPVPHTLREHLAAFFATPIGGESKAAEWAAAFGTVATIGGTGAAIAAGWDWFFAHAAYVLGPFALVMIALFAMLVSGMRKRERRLREQVESDRQQLVLDVTATTQQEIATAIEADLEAARLMWTPEVVAAHVDVDIGNVTIFAADRKTGKPVLYLDVIFTSVAKVPCSLTLKSGECRVYGLPMPGSHICTLALIREPEEFDGSLRPGRISVHRDTRIELPEAAVAQMRSLAMPGVTVAIEYETHCTVGGIAHPRGRVDPIQRIITLPPEWMRSQDSSK